MERAQRALALDPDFVEALEFVGTAFVARQRRFAEGLGLLDRAVALRPDDAGLWYARGWNYEFAAHEMRRRPSREARRVDLRTLYEEAVSSFRRCLSLHPEGKLVGDAEDLLDHVENELLGL
jgi:tetratricopeptide (TPR) repeat protein